MKEIEAITNGLAKNGYAVSTASSLDEFKRLCGEVGLIKQYADVQVDHSKKEYKYSSEIIPFHTDNPHMKYIGLFCISPEHDGGDNLLLDVRPLLDQLSADELNSLRSFEMRLPNGCEKLPLLSGNFCPHIFYLPFFWGKFIEQTEHELPLLKESVPASDCDVPFLKKSMLKFHSLVLACFNEKRYISVALNRGDVLFLDNTYMLHGRQTIPRNSHRHLIRILIAENNKN